MANPQQPELRRSETTPSLTPDSLADELAARKQPTSDGETGPVPADNRPVSGSGPVQDKPDLDAFAAKLGLRDGEDDADAAAKDRPAPKVKAKKAAPVKKPVAKTPEPAKSAAAKRVAEAPVEKAPVKRAPVKKAPATTAASTTATRAPSRADAAKVGAANIGAGSAGSTAAEEPSGSGRSLPGGPLVQLVVGTAGIAAGAGGLLWRRARREQKKVTRRLAVVDPRRLLRR